MTEREDNVYKAKLAEQAERYDGKLATKLMINAAGKMTQTIFGVMPSSSFSILKF